MNINEIRDKCVGCGVCVQVCPRQCITMGKDENGFFMPHIQEENCTQCGFCFKKCTLENISFPSEEPKAFFGASKDLDAVKKSSSGGMFAAFANMMLSRGGVVFGAVYFPEDKEVRHASSEDVPLERMYRSKYVESNLADSYIKVQKKIDEGVPVLFCGTPCQVNGLKQFVKDPNELLLTCDFICHGVPSSRLLKEHLEDYERKYHTKIKQIDFRPKQTKWAEVSRLKIVSDKHPDGHVTLWSFDRYYSGFYSNSTLRESCFSCQFSEHHTADIILADFWGYIYFDKSLNTKDGLSLVLVNSEKGRAALDAILDSTDLQALDYSFAKYVFKRDDISKCLPTRNAFFEQYQTKGFKKAANKTYAKGIGRRRFKFKAVQMIKKCIKKGD